MDLSVCLFDCRTLLSNSGVPVSRPVKLLYGIILCEIIQTSATMFLLETESLDCMSNLFESGFAVNGGLNGRGQSPAHLAACGGQAFCLLWLLQTGADANQQDASGETPMHKAARAGSLECISVLMASEAHFDICNNAGQTAEDIAWSCGFDECRRFLNMHRRTQDLKNASLSSLSERHTLSSTLAGQKRGADSSAQDGKKARDW